MTPHDDIRDEELMASLLSTVRRDAPPPDPALLERLREQSTAAFQDAARTNPLPRRPHSRLVLGLAAVSGLAAAFLVGVGLYVGFRSRNPTDDPGKIPPIVATTDSLHLRVVHAGETGDVWVSKGRLRRDHIDGTYEIADAARAWLVDEKENRATSRKSPYFRDTTLAGVDVLALLGVEGTDLGQPLVEQRPADRIERDGSEYLVYRMDVPRAGGKVEVEALVDAGTRRLHSARARAEKDGKAEDLGELTVVGYNEPVAEDKFVVKDTLTEDGRVGKVVDVQGTVSVRPAMQQRWTPVGNNTILRPGDWVRTDVRGANAALLRLVKQTTVTIGPGALVEVVRPDRVRIHQGDVEVNVPRGDVFDLVALNGQSIRIEGRLLYRAEEERIAQLEKEPLWLKGFKGTVPQEPIGALVAKVDGRDVPLTVGYHKVMVDIRDQIARTTIEESFVNHTDFVLEGVFHFPLPQDASISGFGMWIGDNLVEADVVEKQRAREIYETILTERRDPGLLEWTGGNIFKARVFPIPGHAEKRIKITYTQVLPLRGGSYRYSYALQSEMLQQHPLRQLDIDVRVYSALPLRSVTTPTHMTRDDRTAHAAHVEFTAQEYTPTRDFEVVVEPEVKQQPQVMLIPHRRGEDGYFLLQVLPPATAETPQRGLLPDGQPLRLLVLADTSASMDARQRAQQAAFVAALLGSLTPRDTINLACCDVECDWAFERPMPADPQRLLTARQFLAQRVSLGWTDLDRAFASAFRQCEPGTQVIYVGDGIVTTGDADAAAFAKRLRRLHEEQGRDATCHAVGVGSSFESVALNAIGALGGGSVRRVNDEPSAVLAARGVLDEITRPGLRDLKVELQGLRTARVYPETLPNLAPGSQQIVLGRYLPEGKDQAAEVIVTGRLGDKPVRYNVPVSLKDAEEGNSFIPRLWARMHLDRLLEQGSTDAIRDEIIALSEEYQIITPYTSLLVLESDADRARFNVKRTFRMRDGEKFFAQGRENAGYQLMQQQMKRAGDWRLGLRRQVLRQLAGLGRDPRVAQISRELDRVALGDRLDQWALGLPMLQPEESFLGRTPASGPQSESAPLFFGALTYVENLDGAELGWEKEAGKSRKLKKLVEDTSPDPLVDLADDPLGPLEPGQVAEDTKEKDKEFDWDERRDLKSGALRLRGNVETFGRNKANRLAGLVGKPYGALGGRNIRSSEVAYSDPRPAFDALFQQLPPAPRKQKDGPSSWSAAARELARSLLRNEKLAKLTGGLQIVRQTETFDVQHNRLTQRSRRVELFTPGSWLTRSEDDAAATSIQWCDGRERGVVSLAFQLGRRRASTPEEARTPPLELSDYSWTPLDLAFRGYTVKLELHNKDRVTIFLEQRTAEDYDTRFEVDTARHVILAIEHRENDKVSSRTKFDDFTEVAGCWWARKVESFDADGRCTARSTQTAKEVTAEALRQQIDKELSVREGAQFLTEPLPRIVDAKRAVQDGKASFDDRIALLRHFAASQQWARALEQLKKAEELATGKQGMRWLRDAVLLASRRHEELRKCLLTEAESLARREGPDAFALATHLVSQAGNVFSRSELLTLLDGLRTIYAGRPPHVGAMKGWQQMRGANLQMEGRTDEALRLWKQLATEQPDDLYWQQHYAQVLAQTGNYEAAYDWLKHALRPEAHWSTDEENALREEYARLLEQQSRYADLAEHLAAWVKRDTTGAAPYAQYISALVRSGQLDQAEDLVSRWLKEGQVQGKLSPTAAARLRAAIEFALGRGHNLYTNRIQERWLAPLAEVALSCGRRPDELDVARNIMQSSFSSSEDCRRVRKTITDILISELDRLTVSQLQDFVSWSLADDPPVAPEVWKQVADGLRKRWLAETKPHLRDQLSGVLVQVLASRATPAELLAFLHQRLREGPESYHTAYARRLFEALLAQPWSAEYEDEALALLDKLSTEQEPIDALHAQVTALYELTDRMVEGRYTAQMAKVEHPEKLTRTELKTKQYEARKQARIAFADRLRQEAGKHGKALEPWLTIERAYQDVLVGRDLPKVAAECWTFLDANSPAEVSSDEETPRGLLGAILRHRFLTTVANVTVRKDAGAALIERLLKYVDQGVAVDGEEGHWKLVKYQLLVALDRPKDLETALRQWAKADEADSRWRVGLAYLLAEQGRLAEAVTHLEAVEKTDELDPAAYRTLADWYMVLNRRDAHERALIAAYKVREEWELQRLIADRLSPWQRGDGHVPSELDKEVLLMFAALFEKSSYPANYLWQLQQFYQATRDFRLLAVLAHSVVGHTAGKAYPFLQGMQGIITDIHDEATVDELCAHLEKVRARAKTVVDRRALDLLEAQARRRAAELKNQAGPHGAAALAALQRAFKEQWTEGEPVLMADLLAALGAIAEQPLAKEQLRQLELLHREAKSGTAERLHIAHRYASALWGYTRKNEAIDLLQTALKERQDANGDVLPVSANDALGALVSFFEMSMQHDRGEKLLLAQLRKPAHAQQSRWLTDRLDQLYFNALQQDGRVSLGSGPTLYQALEHRLRDELSTPDQDHRYTTANLICQVYRTAFGKKLPGVADDLRAFAFTQLADVLRHQQSNYDSFVQVVAGTVADLIGPGEAVAFVLDRIDAEPAWLRYNNQDGWSRHAWALGQWRETAKTLPPAVDARLLKVVLAELRRDLGLREARNQVLYYQHNSYYWREKEADFAKTTEEVLARRSQSGPAVEYIAQYFWRGLNHRDRAIEVLLTAHQQKLLDEGGQTQLVQYLHEVNRHGESNPILKPLVERRPDNAQYRVWLMHAYFRTGQHAELLALLKATDAFFHEKDRWNENLMATLARSTLENQLYEASAAYSKEAIGLRERTQPHRGIGDGVLSNYYVDLALAYAGLGKTPEAVDAASSAVVSWGQDHRNREQALNVLLQVLRNAKDLDAYVAHLDGQEAEKGLHNPIVRKAIGQVFAEKGKHREAVTQLQQAAELQPNDADTYKRLLAEHDALNDPEGGVRQLLQAVQLSRRDSKLYQEMGRRLEALGRPREVERAYTSIVEMLPQESEGHALLAEIRQQQNRWGEAIAEWEQVARIRALEPTGLLKLTEAQIHERQWKQATETIKKLRSRSWPARFGDVEQQIRNLEQRITNL
jgi:tetratricopeptide (TPR) repeat protein